MKPVIALYGNVKMQRGYCEECKCMSFIKDGKFSCCGNSIDDKPEKYERMSEPIYHREVPKKEEKEEILRRQDNLCFYCGIPINSYGKRKGKDVLAKLNWDHKIPYSFSQNNSKLNFVASCSVCNGIKSNKIFLTVEEAQLYIAEIRKKKGYDW